MKTIQSVELRKDMSEYLRRAKRGESFNITFRGEDYAELIPKKVVKKESNLPAILAAAEKIRAAMDPVELKRLQSMTDQELKDEYNEYRSRKYSA